MAGDNDNLIMHGASQSGSAQPQPHLLGVRVQDEASQSGGPVLVFNGLAQIAQADVFGEILNVHYGQMRRVLPWLGSVTLGSQLDHKQATKCKLIN